MHTRYTSSLPLNILSEITQYLVMVDLSQILIYLHLHLLFIRHAATNPQISPSVGDPYTWMNNLPTLTPSAHTQLQYSKNLS